MKRVVENVTVCLIVKRAMNNDIKFMKEALKEADKAYKKQEIPVGAVIVYQDKIIARAHNTRVSEKQVFTHAEIKAISKACKKLNSWVLEDCTIYVTLEPCLTPEPKHGVIESVDNVLDNPKFNHKIEVTSGVLQEESSLLLKKFFRELRQNKQHMI